jgi:hypothetical protein
MRAGEPCLERIHFETMPEASYAHVFSTEHPAGAPLDAQAVAFNPQSPGRLARVGGKVGMFYAGTTAIAALFETVLAKASVFADGGVYVHPKFLANKAIARVRLLEALPVLDLRQPRRRKLMDVDQPLDQAWSETLITADYPRTHLIAEALSTQLETDGYTLAGLAWSSRRVQSDTVYLLYDPPCAGAQWEASDFVSLSADEGDDFIDSVLQAHGMYWLGDPMRGVSGPAPVDV